MFSPLLAAILTLAPPTPAVAGLELQVHDLDAARTFYVEGLGYTPTQRGDDRLVLTHGTSCLVLTLGPEKTEGMPGVYLNYQVPELEAALRRLRDCGGTFGGKPVAFPLGVFVEVRDPCGNSLHLLQLKDEYRERSPETTGVFNFGVQVRDLAAAEAFYASLGFEVHSRAYLPETLPLKSAGGVSLVLHLAGDEERHRQTEILLDHPGHPAGVIEDPSGNRIRIRAQDG